MLCSIQITTCSHPASILTGRRLISLSARRPYWKRSAPYLSHRVVVSRSLGTCRAIFQPLAATASVESHCNHSRGPRLLLTMTTTLAAVSVLKVTLCYPGLRTDISRNRAVDAVAARADIASCTNVDGRVVLLAPSIVHLVSCCCTSIGP